MQARLDFQPFWDSGIILLPTNGWFTGPYRLSVTSHPLFMPITMLQFDADSAGKNGGGCNSIRKNLFGPPFLPVKNVFLCGSLLDNPRKRVKLKQKLLSKLQKVVASENLDPDRVSL